MTTVINLLGSPGAGKSTLAADLFAKMKRRGLKVEMVREVAKEWAWAGREIGPFDQIAIIGEQIGRESSLFGKVDYIITDSPVLLGAFYLDYYYDQLFMNTMVKEYYSYGERKGMKFVNFYLPKAEIYDPEGRFESAEDIDNVDEALTLYLAAEGYEYTKLQGAEPLDSSYIIGGLK